jgi:hypothetical protein
MLCILALLPLTSRAVSQVQSATKVGRNDGGPAPSAPRPARRQRVSFYGFLLKQFNPDEVNYGAWMDQRRQAFLNATIRNPYFAYSATVTMGLLVLGTLYGKTVIDHRRVLWATAEMMADLYNQDAYSRRTAREAIQKYNQHIEHCNRAIEAAEDGTTVSPTEAELERMRNQLQSLAVERDVYKRERDLAKSELAEKERDLSKSSLRLDTLTRKSETNRNSSEAAEISTADQELVKQINNLQEKLYVERRENRRPKGS